MAPRQAMDPPGCYNLSLWARPPFSEDVSLKSICTHTRWCTRARNSKPWPIGLSKGFQTMAKPWPIGRWCTQARSSRPWPIGSVQRASTATFSARCCIPRTLAGFRCNLRSPLIYTRVLLLHSFRRLPWLALSCICKAPLLHRFALSKSQRCFVEWKQGVDPN